MRIGNFHFQQYKDLGDLVDVRDGSIKRLFEIGLPTTNVNLLHHRRAARTELNLFRIPETDEHFSVNISSYDANTKAGNFRVKKLNRVTPECNDFVLQPDGLALFRFRVLRDKAEVSSSFAEKFTQMLDEFIRIQTNNSTTGKRSNLDFEICGCRFNLQSRIPYFADDTIRRNRRIDLRSHNISEHSFTLVIYDAKKADRIAKEYSVKVENCDKNKLRLELFDVQEAKTYTCELDLSQRAAKATSNKLLKYLIDNYAVEQTSSLDQSPEPINSLQEVLQSHDRPAISMPHSRAKVGAKEYILSFSTTVEGAKTYHVQIGPITKDREKIKIPIRLRQRNPRDPREESFVIEVHPKDVPRSSFHGMNALQKLLFKLRVDSVLKL